MNARATIAGILLALYLYIPKVSILHYLLLFFILFVLLYSESKIEGIKAKWAQKAYPWIKILIFSSAFLATCSLYIDYFSEYKSITGFFGNPDKNMDVFVDKIFPVAFFGMGILMYLYYGYKEKNQGSVRKNKNL